MTIRYKPDTCDCVLDLEHDTLAFDDWAKKCDLHKNFNGQTLVDEVSTHNISFQITMPNPTKAQKNANMADKIAERIRIKALGPVTKNSANAHNNTLIL